MSLLGFDMGMLRQLIHKGIGRFVRRYHRRDAPNDFETMFRAREDPWNYTSSYEQTKYEQTLAVIPDGTGTALEIGCAEGHFTVQLAPRVKTLVACDIADTALERAAQRCTGLPHVRFVKFDLMHDPIPGTFDLIICSEMLYYLGSLKRLRVAAKKLARGLNPDGMLVMAHMNLLVDEPHETGFDWQLPFGAKIIGQTFQDVSRLRLTQEIRTPLYRIHLFQRISKLQHWTSDRTANKVITIQERPTNLEPSVASHVHWMP